MTVSRRVFLLATVAFLSACASSHVTQEPQPATTLKVDNQGILDMTIYALRGAERVRLGIAGGLKTTVLPIPPRMVFGPTSLRFLGDPIGSNRNPVSDEISIAPGDQVTWTILSQ